MTIIEEILESAGADVRKTTKNSEVLLCCPFCIERGFSDDDHYHLGLNIKNGLAHCFRCDWKSRSIIHTSRQLAKVFHIKFSLRYITATRKAEPEEKKEKVVRLVAIGLPAEYETFTGEDDPLEREARAYLRSRGVSRSQIVRHQIGFAGAGVMQWRVLFPVVAEDDKIYGCVGRAIRDSMDPKYLNTANVKLLWGAHRSGAVAVLCEGIMDALRVEQALLRRSSWVALARLGSTITANQLQQLRKYDRVIVLPDNDEPGVNGAVTLAEQCAEAGLKVEMCVPAVLDGRDPGEMDDEDILGILRDAVPWRKETAWRMRAAKRKGVVL